MWLCQAVRVITKKVKYQTDKENSEQKGSRVTVLLTISRQEKSSRAPWKRFQFSTFFLFIQFNKLTFAHFRYSLTFETVRRMRRPIHRSDSSILEF